MECFDMATLNSMREVETLQPTLENQFNTKARFILSSEWGENMIKVSILLHNL